MTTFTRIALTVAVAVALLVTLAGSIALANVLPGVWALLVLPVMASNGWVASDAIGTIWQLEGQYDDGR